MNFMGYFYDFIIDYDAIAVDYVLDIQRYLTKRIIYERSDSIKMFDFIKKRIFIAITVFSCIALNESLWKCVLMNS